MGNFINPLFTAPPQLIRPPNNMPDDLLLQTSQWQREALINSLKNAGAQQQGGAFK